MLSPLSCPSKKQLRVGAACWLCAGPLPELPAWLGRYARVLLLSAIRANLPPAASASGQPGRGERCERSARPVSKSSCAWAWRAGSAQGTVPRALPGSVAMIGCFSHQPDALTCHPQRGHPPSLAAESVPDGLKSHRWPAVMTPRLAALRADDVGASHRAADGGGPSIQGARTHAHATSRGAVAAVSCAGSALRRTLSFFDSPTRQLSAIGCCADQGVYFFFERARVRHSRPGAGKK